MMTDTDYMKLSLWEAKKALAAGEIPIGAVLTYQDVVIATAHNTRENSHDPTAHAEILAIRKGALLFSNWRLTECTLYVTIEPCAMCAGAIMNARIKKLVYGAPNKQAGGVDSHFHICDGHSMNHNLAIRSGVLAAECQAVMDKFFKQHRNYGDVSKWS